MRWIGIRASGWNCHLNAGLYCMEIILVPLGALKAVVDLTHGPEKFRPISLLGEGHLLQATSKKLAKYFVSPQCSAAHHLC